MTIPHGHGYRPFRQRFELIVPRSHDGAERRGTYLIGRRVGADHGPRCQAPARDSVDGVDATSQPQLSGLSHLRRRSGGQVMNVSANIPAACRIDISMSPSSPNGASLLSLRATTRRVGQRIAVSPVTSGASSAARAPMAWSKRTGPTYLRAASSTGAPTS